MKTFLKIVLTLAAIGGIVFLLGPKPAKPNLAGSLPNIDVPLSQLDAHIAAKEAKVVGIKANNEAKIVWADTAKKQKTPIAVVYIHGFSASRMEGDPVHRQFAKRYGANLYLARLAGHGVETENNFEGLTSDNLLESAREAVAIGKKLGDKVVVIGTSAGGALTLQVATENPDLLGLILYSPCIRIFDEAARVLNDPWGKNIAKVITGSEFVVIPEQEPESKMYWTKRYNLDGVVALENFIEAAFTDENLAKVTQPTFMGYYFKDAENQDKVVSVPAMLEMFEKIKTPASQKRKTAFPESGDHVIASSIKSKTVKAVADETFKFAEEVLKLKPVQ